MPGEVTFPELVATERLTMHRYNSVDAAGLLELVHRNRASLIQNFSQMAKGLSQGEDVKSFREEKAEQWETRRAFLLRYLAQSFKATNRTASSKKYCMGCAVR